MQSWETQITMVKWTNAGGQTKRANERSFVYRPPAWRRWRNVKTTYNTGTVEGEGLVGPWPHHFFAPPPPLFALKRKIIKIKRKTSNKFFPSIFRYILCIFFNFKRQAFCGAPVLFAVIVPWGRLAPWSNAMPWQLPWPPLRFVRQHVL